VLQLGRWDPRFAMIESIVSAEELEFPAPPHPPKTDIKITMAVKTKQNTNKTQKLVFMLHALNPLLKMIAQS
jgi:hypothetical protein